MVMLYILKPDDYDFKQNFNSGADYFEHLETGHLIPINGRDGILEKGCGLFTIDKRVTITISISCRDLNCEYIEYKKNNDITKNSKWAEQVKGTTKNEEEKKRMENYHNRFLEPRQQKIREGSLCKCSTRHPY